jgi:excisionase family DNA binding protein
VPDQSDEPLAVAVKLDRYLNYHEAAAYLRCTPDQVRRRVAAGLLESYKPLGQQKRLIRAVDIREALRDGLVA